MALKYSAFHVFFCYIILYPSTLIRLEGPYLNDEWQSSAISIAITYLVFVMGIPALIFQTFIPDGLRHVYNERFEKGWGHFSFLIILILFLFVISNPSVNKVLENEHLDGIGALAILLIVITILVNGGMYFRGKFDSMKNVEKNLSERIVTNALHNIKNNTKKEGRDLEDLAILGKEISPGTKKEIFLKECERLVEELLDFEKRDTRLIGEILRHIVCASIDLEKGKFSRLNVEKVMEILTLANDKAFRNGGENYSYLRVEISDCIKNIAIKAMVDNDTTVVEVALDKLSLIEAPSIILYTLGHEALLHKHAQTSIAVATTLRNRVIESMEENAPPLKDKHLFDSWLGLVAKIQAISESSKEFAMREIALVDMPDQTMKTLVKNASRHFSQQADFVAVDAVNRLGLLISEKQMT